MAVRFPQSRCPTQCHGPLEEKGGQRGKPDRGACRGRDSLLLALRTEEGDRGWWALGTKHGLRVVANGCATDLSQGPWTEGPSAVPAPRSSLNITRAPSLWGRDSGWGSLGFSAVHCLTPASLPPVLPQPGTADRRPVCLRAAFPPCLRGAVHSGGEAHGTESHAVLLQLHPIRVSGPGAVGAHPAPPNPGAT